MKPRAASFVLLLSSWCTALHAAPVDDEIVARGNAFRRAHGLAPLRAETRLAAAALAFARHMAASGRYGHDADGRNPAQRVQAQGYGWCRVAENIAWQYSSAGFAADELPPRFMQGWIDSPPHRKNLLDAAAVDTGVAVVQAPGGRWYAVQLLARPGCPH